MKNGLIVVGLVGMLVGGCLCLAGCKQESIKFNRESAASNLINKINNSQKITPSKQGGMVILKDESYQADSIRFGPKDIDFDIK